MKRTSPRRAELTRADLSAWHATNDEYVLEGLRAMKTFLLQIIILIFSIAAIVGLKKMDLQAWFTYPLLAILLVLAIFGIVGATFFDRKSSSKQTIGTIWSAADIVARRAISIPALMLSDEKLPNRNE